MSILSELHILLFILPVACIGLHVYQQCDQPFWGSSLTAKKAYILQNQNLPQHVAIIMDGNGRWAKNKGDHDYLDIKTA